jgi:hypothetical protein
VRQQQEKNHPTIQGTCSNTITKTNETNFPLKDALREWECLWLINFTSQENPDNVGLFDNCSNPKISRM